MWLRTLTCEHAAELHTRIYGVFALDCVIQMLLLLTGSVFREFKSVDVSKEQLRHLTQDRKGVSRYIDM